MCFTALMEELLRARKSKQTERTPKEIETLPSDDITSIWTKNHMPGLSSHIDLLDAGAQSQSSPRIPPAA